MLIPWSHKTWLDGATESRQFRKSSLLINHELVPGVRAWLILSRVKLGSTGESQSAMYVCFKPVGVNWIKDIAVGDVRACSRFWFSLVSCINERKAAISSTILRV